MTCSSGSRFAGRNSSVGNENKLFTTSHRSNAHNLHQGHNYDGHHSERNIHNTGRHSDKRSSSYSSQSKPYDRGRKRLGQHQNTSNNFNKSYYPNYSNDGNSGRNQNKYWNKTTHSQDRQNQYHRNKSSGYGNTGNYNSHSREAEATYYLSSYGPQDDNKNNTSVIGDVENNGVSIGQPSNNTANVDLISSTGK